MLSCLYPGADRCDATDTVGVMQLEQIAVESRIPKSLPVQAVPVDITSFNIRYQGVWATVDKNAAYATRMWHNDEKSEDQTNKDKLRERYFNEHWTLTYKRTYIIITRGQNAKLSAWKTTEYESPSLSNTPAIPWAWPKCILFVTKERYTWELTSSRRKLFKSWQTSYPIILHYGIHRDFLPKKPIFKFS